ncbi:MAG: DUF58 domain-containing protein [Planctomycetota bacterium]
MDPSTSTSTKTTLREPLLDDEFLVKIERLSLVSRSTILGKIRGERRSRRRGFSTEFADYRDYVPGDDLRYLDWNIFGRLERLFIKLFHEEEDLTVSILVDVSPSMVQGNPEKLRYALQVAAALGYIALSAEDRVGVFPFAADIQTPFQPLRGRNNARRLFRYLQALPTGEATDLQRSLRTYMHAFAQRGMVILISDLLDPQGYDEALRSIAGSRFETFLVHLLSPEEIEPPLTGDLRLVDCEDGNVAEVSINRTLRAAYRRTVAGFKAGIRESCSRKGIVPLFASTQTPFEQLVLGYLRSRGMVR